MEYKFLIIFVAISCIGKYSLVSQVGAVAIPSNLPAVPPVESQKAGPEPTVNGTTTHSPLPVPTPTPAPKNDSEVVNGTTILSTLSVPTPAPKNGSEVAGSVQRFIRETYTELPFDIRIRTKG